MINRFPSNSLVQILKPKLVNVTNGLPLATSCKTNIFNLFNTVTRFNEIYYLENKIGKIKFENSIDNNLTLTNQFDVKTKTIYNLVSITKLQMDIEKKNYKMYERIEINLNPDCPSNLNYKLDINDEIIYSFNKLNYKSNYKINYNYQVKNIFKKINLELKK